MALPTPNGIHYNAEGLVPMGVGLVNENGDAGGIYKPPKGYSKEARKAAGKMS